MWWILYSVLLIKLVKLFINLHRVFRHRRLKPEALLLLGGEIEREEYGAELMRTKYRDYDDMHLWVSSGHITQPQHPIYHLINHHRLHIDKRAIDTITNYTSLVNDFLQYKFVSSNSSNSTPSSSSLSETPRSLTGIRHAYIITSHYHLRRAMAVGWIIFGMGAGIALTPLPAPTIADNTPHSESFFRLLRDCIRAMLWVMIGIDGQFVSRIVHPRRYARSIRQ